VENNKLSSLKPGAFNNLKNLRNLNLSHNAFTALTPNFFWKPENENDKTFFFTVQVNFNEISEIKPGAFDGVDRIEDLQLYGNKLSKFAKDSFKGLSFVGYLNLQKNQIGNPDVFANLPPARQIQIGGNTLESSMVVPKDLDLKKELQVISFNYCCYKIEDGAWIFDETFIEPAIIE